MTKIKNIISDIIEEIISETSGSSIYPGELDLLDLPDDLPKNVNNDDELDDEDAVEEVNSNANAGNMDYNIPGVFSKTNGTDTEAEGGHKDPEVFDYRKMDKTYVNVIPWKGKKLTEFKKLAKEYLLNEITYRAYKYDQTYKPHQKINRTISEVNSKLIKVERMIRQAKKLRKEAGVGKDKYWKITESKLKKLRERIYRIMNGLNDLNV